MLLCLRRAWRAHNSTAWGPRSSQSIRTGRKRCLASPAKFVDATNWWYPRRYVLLRRSALQSLLRADIKTCKVSIYNQTETVNAAAFNTKKRSQAGWLFLSHQRTRCATSKSIRSQSPSNDGQTASDLSCNWGKMILISTSNYKVINLCCFQMQP